MKRVVLFSIILSGCYVSIDPGPIECIYDTDCLPGDICVNGMCEFWPELLPSRTVIQECQCWNDFVYIGETFQSAVCSSGLEVIQSCIGCCEYWYHECVKPMLGRFCL